ncbi:MAG: carboxypeptidase-like regulatory domain-containing protein [Phycisphaerae bacterium]
MNSVPGSQAMIPLHGDGRATVRRRVRILVALFVGVTIGRATPARQPESQPPSVPDAADAPTQQEQPAEEFVIVEGQITDHIGAGQKDVTVTVRRKTENAAEGEIIATTTTDKLGDFAVRVSKPIRGDIVVTFTKPQYAELTHELHIGDDEFPPFIAGMLEGKLMVIGRVTDALTTQPIPGAAVILRSMYKDWRETTDDRGRFTIKGVFPGKGELIVQAESYGRQRQPVERLDDTGEIVVHLKPERIVHIKAVDDLGKPIAGVTIECYDKPRDDFRTVVTDENGTVTLRGLHFDAAALSLRLTHEDHVSGEGFDREILTPDREAKSTHQLVMARAGQVSGNVADATTGKPLYGARVMTGDGHSDYSPRDWTDYQGRYTIRGVRPGSTVLTVHLSGYAPQLRTVDVKAGETSPLDVQLDPGAVLKGIVRNETGDPIAGARVETTQWRGHTTLGLRAVTGRDGHFVIESAPHDEFEITVCAKDFGTVTKTVNASDGGTIEITLPSAQADPDADIKREVEQVLKDNEPT